MGSIEVTVDSEIIQDLILGQRDEAIRKLVETILNEVLEAEMDEHLQAKRHVPVRQTTFLKPPEHNRHSSGVL